MLFYTKMLQVCSQGCHSTKNKLKQKKEHQNELIVELACHSGIELNLEGTCEEWNELSLRTSNSPFLLRVVGPFTRGRLSSLIDNALRRTRFESRGFIHLVTSEVTSVL